jgi:hypothetical protein
MVLPVGVEDKQRLVVLEKGDDHQVRTRVQKMSPIFDRATGGAFVGRLAAAQLRWSPQQAAGRRRSPPGPVPEWRQ